MNLIKILSFMSLLLLTSINIYSQSGNIKGKITDASDGSALWGANIILSGTSNGTSTNSDGKYRLTNIPEGESIIVFRYLGYAPDSVKVNIIAGKTLQLDIKLHSRVIQGEEVVVTSQLQGQAAAINQQVNSNTIVNIVSKDRIQELPDQNAAESVGRLPGISVERDAGEGTKVVVRGLAPKFNSITINGERIPATDPENRSVDLSMISSDMLEGIEVYKTLTPDLDADAIGGTVNFDIKKAPKGIRANFRLNDTYNAHEKDAGLYKGSFSGSERFFNDKLGAMITANFQRANRSSDLLDAGYSFAREDNQGNAIVNVSSLNLEDHTEIRKRYGGSVTLDYKLDDNNNFTLSSLYGGTDRNELRMSKRYKVEQSYVEYWLRNRQLSTSLYSNTLIGNHHLGFIDIQWKGSYSLTERNMPRSHDSQFRELGAYTGSLIEDKGPQYIPEGAKNNLDETFFKQDFIDNELTKDHNATAQIDFKIPFAINSNISGFIKAGSKYRSKRRSRDNNELFTLAFTINDLGAANPDKFDLTREGKIKISNFEDPNYSDNNFLDGAYKIPLGLDKNLLDNFSREFASSYVKNGAMDLEDYTAGEAITAAYLMSVINIGTHLKIIPGFRYERTQNDYSSVLGEASLSESGTVSIIGKQDTLGKRAYDEILPMVNLKLNVTPWFDIRLAVTKSLSRPDYFNLVPWERISDFEETVEKGNPNLKHTKAWNYDAFFSFYGNFGLFTLGAFYKSLRDIDYIRTSRITEPGRTQGYQLTEPENSKYETIVRGVEMELQTNLTFLPSPFDGIIIYANYSIIRSRTYYPLLAIGPRMTEPPFSFTFIDTVREGRMPEQPDNIANLSIGYEKCPFSGRISMIYQGESLQTIGTRKELDGYTSTFVRWDFSVSYKLFENIGMFLNVNNLNNLPEKSFLGNKTYSTREEIFGWTSDLGVTYKF